MVIITFFILAILKRISILIHYMKKFLLSPLFTFLFLANSFCFGQDNNNSLLWEISGNGLEKKSYLYGTMHVSDRVSYHLTDAFFKHLTEADIVATESDFNEWASLEELLNDGTSNQMENLWLDVFDSSKGGFYSNFRLQPANRRDILTHFHGITYSTNNLLFRTSPQNQDFQEITYLDMFIYQAGKKLNKKTVGLEQAKEVLATILNLDFEDIEMPSEETIQALFRLLRNRTPEEALADFYREKDIELIYRFMELTMPEHWRNDLLYNRNEIMVRSIDSLAQKGSLFASMGAGHLAGERGAIELLRKKGYTVTPVHSDYTEWGREKKKKIDELFVIPSFSLYITVDQMASVPMPGALLHNKANTSSPDLSNGGAVNLKRLPLNDFIVEKENRFNHLSLDSLFFENIPGEILSKEFFQEKHLQYYDIKNITRSGNTHRYRFYITPLELVTISMIGPGNYTRQFEEEVFSHISIKNPSDTWETVIPTRGGFSVSLPGYHIIYGSKENPAHPENIEIQAFDPSNNSYYFLLKKSPDGFIFENSIYELERIQSEFYIQYDATEYSVTGSTFNSLTSESTIHGKNIHLKTIIDGNFYYLAGCIECNTHQKEQMFESFTLIPYHDDTGFRLYSDVNFLFSLDLPYRQNELLFLTNTPTVRVKPPDKDEWFASASKSYSFQSANGHKVDLFVYRYHPYITEVSVDSLFRKLNRRFLTEYAGKENAEEASTDPLNDEEDSFAALLLEIMEKESQNTTGSRYFGALHAGPVISGWEHELDLINNSPYTFENEQQYYVEDGDYHVFKAFVRREGTLGQLKRMIVFKDGIRYILETPVPYDYNNDNTFVERLFESFTPADTILPHSVFENKLPLFIEHLQSDNDSIRLSALNSVTFLNFTRADLPEIQKILDIVEITNRETEYIKVLFKKIAEVNDPHIFEFIDTTYRKHNINTTLKLALLKGLANQKNHYAYEKIIELLDYYLPIPERKVETQRLFREFERNLEYSSALIPRIFDHFIVEEYKSPILDFSRKFTQSSNFDAEKLEPVKDIILANANIEFRRTRSWVNNRKSQKRKILGFDAVNTTRDLLTYIYLIHPFTGEERFAQWWNNVSELQIPEIQIEMLNLSLNRMATDTDLAQKLLQKEETRFAATVLLSLKDPGFKLPNIPEAELARSAVVLFDHVDLENQDLTFYKETKTQHNEKTVRFYFYKCKDKETPRGQVEETILMSKGFVLDDNGMIIPRAFFSGLQKPIKDPDKIDEYIFEVIDQSLNWNNQRATYEKNDFTASPFFGFDFF